MNIKLADGSILELAKGTQAKVYTDYKEMQKHETLDGVILNLPHFLHKDVSIFFLEKC